MNTFKEINIKDFKMKIFYQLDDEWMLISAKNKNGDINTMTASWGSFGIMWNKPAVSIVIRPQRYTKEFIDDNNEFSICLFDFDKYKKDLAYLGNVSGRDEKNKIEKTSLTTRFIDNYPIFNEAHTIITCKVKFCQEMTAQGFYKKQYLDDFYKDKDYHFLYIGEIEKIYINK